MNEHCLLKKVSTPRHTRIAICCELLHDYINLYSVRRITIRRCPLFDIRKILNGEF